MGWDGIGWLVCVLGSDRIVRVWIDENRGDEEFACCGDVQFYRGERQVR